MPIYDTSPTHDDCGRVGSNRPVASHYAAPGLLLSTTVYYN